MENLLKKNEIKQNVMIENISDVIIIMGKSGIINYISPNVQKIFGWKSKELLDYNLWEIIHSDEKLYVKKELSKILEKDGMIKTLEYKLKCSDGTYRDIENTSVNLINDESINGILMNFHDITYRKKRENDILYLSYHDVLTGLYNRAYFDESIESIDIEDQFPISIIMGDVNGLKLINDAFGHAEGDKVLCEIAKILKKCCRESDIIARIGGDEFYILLPKTDNDTSQLISRNIYKECENYGNSEDKDAIYLSISIGYATKTIANDNMESIFKDAEEFMYRHKLLEHKSMHSTILASIKATMFEKSKETEAHAERLISLSKAVGQALCLSDEQMNELELLSTLHDIGKMSVNDNILFKPGKLTDLEWSEIKKHPEVGYRIAQASPELMPIAEYILCHHERWDGKGYPQGLMGEGIPLLSRIISVVDSYDAMTYDRVYSKAISKEAAIEEIFNNAGKQFDPVISKTFIQIIS